MPDFPKIQIITKRTPPETAVKELLLVVQGLKQNKRYSITRDELDKIKAHFMRFKGDFVEQFLNNSHIYADLAMSNNIGGIDFKTINKGFQLWDNGSSIKFQMDPAMLQELEKTPGFIITSMTIQPLKSLSEFLGVHQLSASTKI